MQLQDKKSWCQLRWNDSFKDNSLLVSEQIGGVGSLLPKWSVSKMKRNGMATLKTLEEGMQKAKNPA